MLTLYFEPVNNSEDHHRKLRGNVAIIILAVDVNANISVIIAICYNEVCQTRMIYY